MVQRDRITGYNLHATQNPINASKAEKTSKIEVIETAVRYKLKYEVTAIAVVNTNPTCAAKYLGPAFIFFIFNRVSLKMRELINFIGLPILGINPRKKKSSARNAGIHQIFKYKNAINKKTVIVAFSRAIFSLIKSREMGHILFIRFVLVFKHKLIDLVHVLV